MMRLSDVRTGMLLSCMLVIAMIPLMVFSQSQTGQQSAEPVYYGDTMDKCGFDPALAEQMKAILGGNWGYGYDSLLVDLKRWGQSPYVTIDSIGASVLNLALWQLTITSDTPPPAGGRHTVFMHVRTHPGEVQSFWVANEVINLLLSDDPFAAAVRENCVFYIIPMYNPDGVELGLPRQNANGIDIESNWNASQVQPEVAALQKRFSQLMSSSNPIEVALNMHSSVLNTRYFVYHDAAGTSPYYADLEQQFIGGVRSHFPGGIEPWNFFVSWTSGTATQYPESWFWLHFADQVMALTYEDNNSPDAGGYDSTAYALVHGVMDYLGISTRIVGTETNIPAHFVLNQNYPNPFNPTTTISYELASRSAVRLILYNSLGQEIRTLISGIQAGGTYTIELNGANLPSGVYYYRLETAGAALVRKCMLLK
ncbi:MAG: M14 family zinc carboxypeptidase [Calditrichia bacterium]